MRSFDNLLTRYGFITEAKTSPFAGTHPSFGGITKSMATRGMSSAPYDTVKFLATFLYELDIISDDERKMILKGQGFKGKQLALLEVIKGKSQEIVANSARIEEAMPTELENYINRATLNRGRDMMPDAKVEGGSGGRRDKYAAQAAELAAKRKAAGEAKQQTLALKAAARGEEADVQSAVDVLVNTLDDADREVVDRADVAAGIGFKGAEDVKLNFDDIDINIGVIKDRDTLVDKLVKFFNKQPNFTAEKTRRGVNVEGPSGSFGTSVQDAEDMILSLVMRARPDIDEAQIVVDLHSDKAVSEDEEYGASRGEETKFHKKLDSMVHDTFGKRKGEDEEGSGNVYQGEAETVFYGDDGEEVDGVIYYTATKDPRTGQIDIQLTGGDVTGYNPASKVDDDYIEYIISHPKYIEDYIADARADAEGRFGSMPEDEEGGGNVYQGEAETVFYGDDGEEVDGVVYYTATKNPETGEIDIQLTGGDVTGYNPASKVDDDYIEFIIANPQYNQDHIADARADAEGRFGSVTEDEEGEDYDRDDTHDWDYREQEWNKNNRPCSECGSRYYPREGAQCPLCRADSEDEDNEEYNAKKADVDRDGKTEPWERGIARKRGFKNAPEDEEGCDCEDEEGCNCDEETPYMESYTSIYLEGMTRRSHKQEAAPQTMTFKERMKPKTWKQLAELRNYGM